jgi:hypothetical protein
VSGLKTRVYELELLPKRISSSLTCSGDGSSNGSSQKIPGDIVILRGRHDDITIDADLGNYFLHIVEDLLQSRLAWKQLQ